MIKLFNSLTQRKEAFKPLTPPQVRMYSCGPTVYDRVHIGNLRSFITADVLARSLRELEHYDIRWVMNITDIDDKMIDKVRQQYPGQDPQTALHTLADRYIEAFKSDLNRININRNGTDIQFIRATDNIALMQDLIRGLHRDGLAYISDGSVYFNLQAYRESGRRYGLLVNLRYEPQARVTDDQDQKEGVADFALWKTRRDREPYWEFELDGHSLPGRPGWHIECSAMSIKELGKPFDIHTGGVDLKFPHHENEIAQAEGELAQFFIHNEFLNVNAEKMSKSLNNFVTLEDIESPIAFRLRVLQAHYRSQFDFTTENVAQARDLLNKLRGIAARLAQGRALPASDRVNQAAQITADYRAAMSDDLNTPMALAELVKAEGIEASQKLLEFIHLADATLGLELFDGNEWSGEEQSMISARESARTNKDYAKSDELRLRLESARILSEDTKDGGVYWRAM